MCSTVDDYRCSLKQSSVDYAEIKLSESPSDRQNAINSLRQWVHQQRDWLDTPTDATFLLSFLRMRKFSQVFSRRCLTNYWLSRDKYPQWFYNVDTHDPALRSVLANGSYLSLPGYDKLGRRVLLGRPGLLDTSGRDYTCDDVIKTGFALSDYWLMDESTQVHGFVVFMDFTGLGLRHQSFYGLANLRNNTTLMTKIYPIRTQEVHQYNMGRVGETVYTVARPFLPFKVKERMFMHSTLASVYELIDPAMLPEEYLPDDYEGPNAGPVDKLVEKLVEEMTSQPVRDHLLQLSSKKTRVDLNLKPGYDEVATESFRIIAT